MRPEIVCLYKSLSAQILRLLLRSKYPVSPCEAEAHEVRSRNLHTVLERIEELCSVFPQRI